MNRNLDYTTLWRVQRCPNQLFGQVDIAIAKRKPELLPLHCQAGAWQRVSDRLVLHGSLEEEGAKPLKVPLFKGDLGGS
jgi:hypothetical protein